MKNINISIVLYDSINECLEESILYLLGNNLINKIYIIDNSRNPVFSIVKGASEIIEYIHTGKNIGYGKGHNIALRLSMKERIKYHVVLNPDVKIYNTVIQDLYHFMESNPDVGLVMPKVLSPDGSIQYLCKLLPGPFDLLRRRFFNWGPFKKFNKKKDFIFELRFTNYERPMNVPFLSGCFMFIRTEVLQKVGLFDERFFLYCDDLDLSRRIHKVSKTVFYPYCSIYHEWGRGSYKNFRMLMIHIRDAIKYFNKWGWFNDSERKKINMAALKDIIDNSCTRDLKD